VIGGHAQGAKDEEVRAKCKSLGINYSVVKAAFTKESGVNGIPYCLLFDHSGKCIHGGKPESIDKQLRSAIGAALVAGLEEAPKTKSVAALATSLKSGQAPSAVLQRAVPLLKTKDTAVAEEAKQLIDKICFVGRQQYDEAEQQKGDDPFAAYTAIEKLPTQYRGTPLATDATKLLTELKKDKTVQTELKARPQLTAIKTIDANLTKSAGVAKLELTDPKFLKANGQVLQNLRKNVIAMKKSFPEAKATEQAVAIAEKYGIMLP
jgi:hypothetical protein